MALSGDEPDAYAAWAPGACPGGRSRGSARCRPTCACRIVGEAQGPDSDDVAPGVRLRVRAAFEMASIAALPDDMYLYRLFGGA